MSKPIQNQVKGVFIPVSNIEKARDWYCHLLGLPIDGEILFGHLYVLPVQSGPNIVLDSKIYAPDHIHRVAAIQISTDNIERAYDFVKSNDIKVLTEIENGHWFNIQDPDGNVLMICQ